MNADELRGLIETSLNAQGFQVERGRIVPPPGLTKDGIRVLHALAVQHRVDKAKPGLRPHESVLLERLAYGREVVPERITPKLVEVQRGSADELLFRYARLHWSIPTSAGYGRRLRFLVIDQQNDKLIGLFGLGDPVFGMAPRDRFIGWDKEGRRQRLHHVVDAFVLGAVPPYSDLLCGKLAAMLAASNEVREAFARKYSLRSAVISGRPLDGQLAMLTTTSALGRSSLYNRITYGGHHMYFSVGLTRGSGDFHFSNGLYDAVWEYASDSVVPTAKHARWGSGFRNRREVVRKCLGSLGLSTDWVYHGIKREVLIAPLARNTREYLKGEDQSLDYFDRPAADLFEWFRKRWLLPRAQRNQRYLEFTPLSYRLWDKEGNDSGDQSGPIR